MMKKRIAAVALSCMTLSMGVMAGCKPPIDSGDVQVDTTKSQLSVANYDGGVGSDWFRTVIKNFEEKYAKVSFEDGKEGVQIVPDIGKADHLTQIATDSYNVIFG